MNYSIGEKIYSELYKDNMVILSIDDAEKTYLACFEKDMKNDKDRIYTMDDKKLELLKVGYFYAMGEMLKFGCIYNKFEAVYGRSAGSSGLSVNLNNTSYRILNDEEINEFEHFSFRQMVLDGHGIELDEEIYRVNDVIKFSHDHVEYLGEICEVSENYLTAKVCGKTLKLERDKVIHWYPKDNYLNMQGNTFYKQIER